jgi:hypothetical protein
MLTKAQAQKQVEHHINQPDPYWPEKPRIVVLKEDTIEKDWGWVFFYESSAYLDTGDFSSKLAGNAPFIVNKDNGELRATGTAYEIEHYIDEYEKTLRE